MSELTENTHEIPGRLAELPVTISFKHSYRLVVDPDYGADADGRRGVRQTFIEDEDVRDIRVAIDGVESPLDEIHPNSQADIMSQIAEFLNGLNYE